MPLRNLAGCVYIFIHILDIFRCLICLAVMFRSIAPCFSQPWLLLQEPSKESPEDSKEKEEPKEGKDDNDSDAKEVKQNGISKDDSKEDPKAGACIILRYIDIHSLDDAQG